MLMLQLTQMPGLVLQVGGFAASAGSPSLGSPQNHAGDAAQTRRRQHPRFESRVQESLLARDEDDGRETDRNNLNSPIPLMCWNPWLPTHPGVAGGPELRCAAQEIRRQNRQCYCQLRRRKSITIRTQTGSTRLSLSTKPRHAPRFLLSPFNLDAVLLASHPVGGSALLP